MGDDEDSFERFMGASNDDEESLHLRSKVKQPVPKGGGYGDVHRSQQFNSSNYGGGGGMYGSSRDPFGDPYATDISSMPKPAQYVPKPAKQKAPQGPQVRAAGQGDAALGRSSQFAGKQNLRQSEELNRRSEEKSKSVERQPSAASIPDQKPDLVMQAEKDLSDSESQSASLPQGNEANQTGNSLFASMAAEFQKSVANMAEEMKAEEEKRAKEEEERLHEEEERKQREEEEAKQREEELERMRKEEEERKRKAEAARVEEDRRKKEEEEKRKKEEEERLRTEGRRLRLEEEERKKEEERRKQAEEEEAQRRKKGEEERRLQDEEARSKKEEEEEAARRKSDEEQRRLKTEEEERNRLEAEQQKAEIAQSLKDEAERKRSEGERKQHELGQVHARQERERQLRLEEERGREEAQTRSQSPEQERQARQNQSSRDSSRDIPPRLPLPQNEEGEKTRRHAELPSSSEMGGRLGFGNGTPRTDATSNCSDGLQDFALAMHQDGSRGQGDAASESRRSMSEAGGQTPRQQLPDARPSSRHAFPNASAGSGPLMASVVRDSLGSLPGSSAALGWSAVAPRPDQYSHHDDRWRLPCDDGKLLLLKSTESAEMEEKMAFFRAHGLEQSGLGDRSAPAGSPSFNLTSSLLMDPSVNSDIMALAGLRQSANTGQGLEAKHGLYDVSQRIDRGKLETLHTEIEALRKKIAVLEEFNADLANNKARAEAESVRAGEQAMLLRLENRKLEEAMTAKSSALREAARGCHELEHKLHKCERQLEDQARSRVQEVAAAQQKLEEAAARLAALMAENAGLHEECETLKEDLYGAPAALLQKRQSGALGAGGSDKGSDADDLQNEVVSLQAELRNTGDMLRGTEKENENLAQQNRQLRQSARLKKEEIEGRHLQICAELNNARASADTNPASMRRVGELERELQMAKERCDEHAKELERSREARRQLERELLNGAPAAPSAETAKQLAEATAERSRLESEVGLLRSKVDWYVESQREMEDDRRNVLRIGEEVRELRTENGELKRRPGAKESGRRAAELHKQVEQLQDCLRKRNPDSILNLVKACEPKPEEKKELRALKGKVEELEVKLTERDETYDRQVRALRGQYDRLRIEYEKRSTLGDTSIMDESVATGREETRRAAPDRDAVLKARIQDLERQVEHTKSYYLTKLRKREPLVPPKPSRSAASTTAQHREMNLQMTIKERDARIEALSKELHFHTMDEAAKPSRCGTGDRTSSSSTMPSPAFLRVFLASPEAPAIASLSAELRVMGHAVRQQRYDDVASQAKNVLAILAAEEAASGVLASFAPMAFHAERNVLRLQAQPPLPSAVWSVWRKLVEQIAAVAAEASFRSQDGAMGGAAEGIHSDLATALARLGGSLDSVIFHLIFAPVGLGNVAWGPEVQGLVQSLLPRILLERVCEELQVAGSGQTFGVLNDAQVHADVDGRLRWSELEGVLARCGAAGTKLVDECRSAAHPDWTLSLTELQHLLTGDGGQEPLHAPCSGLIRTLTRIKLVVVDHEPPLPLLFRSLDVAGRGFVMRPEFMEALRNIRCALSSEECGQLAVFFSPAVNPRFVCYPLFLQSVVPTRGEGSDMQACWPPAMLKSTAAMWAEPASALGGAGQPPVMNAARFDVAERMSELQAENIDLREHTRALTERCAENAALVAQSPAHVVRRLQGEMAALETRMLEQQTALTSGSRRAEITLRGDLDVSRHEVASLRQALESRDAEVERYKEELQAIIGELMALKGE